MNSPFANIFIAIQQRVQSQLPEIRYTDQDLGQLKSGSRPPVSWPCVLIDFEDFSYSNLSENVQTAAGTVVLRLGFAPHSNSGQATPDNYLKQSLNYYDLEWSLHKFMQGWSPGSDCGHLCRISATTQKRTDGYRVREIRYSIAFDDYSTRYQQRYAPAAIVINEDIVL
jgi:hypothetical protein